MLDYLKIHCFGFEENASGRQISASFIAKNLLYLCAAFIFSLCIQGTLYQIDGSKGFIHSAIQALPSSLGAVVLTLAVSICAYLFIAYAFNQNKVTKYSIGIASLFTIFLLVGNAFSYRGSLNYLYCNSFSAARCLALIFMYELVLNALLLFLNTAFEKDFNKQHKIPAFLHNKKKSFFAVFAFITLAWLPYFVVYYPACIEYDIIRVLPQAYGVEPLTNAVPIVQTYLLFAFTQLGSWLGNANTGLALLAGIQALVFAALIAYSVLLLLKIEIPFAYLCCYVCLFAFVPLFPIYAITIGKDMTFGIALFALTLQLFKLFMPGFKPVQLKDICILAALLILLPLLRNAAVGISVVVLLVILYTNRTNLKPWLSVAAVVCVSFALWNWVFLPLCEIAPSEPTENMSIMFQQTARYVKNHKVENWEEESIDRVLDFDNLAKKYDPEISDPVKNSHRKDLTSEDFDAYFKAYRYGFTKAPGSYVQAFLNMSYGYYYPACLGNKRPYVFDGLNNLNTGLANKKCNLNLENAHPHMVEKITDKVTSAREIPLLGLLTTSGFYAWVLIVAMFYINRKGTKGSKVLYIPALLIFLGCLASPVNAYMRYSIPMIYSTPFLFLVSLSFLKKD